MLNKKWFKFIVFKILLVAVYLILGLNLAYSDELRVSCIAKRLLFSRIKVIIEVKNNSDKDIYVEDLRYSNYAIAKDSDNVINIQCPFNMDESDFIPYAFVFPEIYKVKSKTKRKFVLYLSELKRIGIDVNKIAKINLTFVVLSENILQEEVGTDYRKYKQLFNERKIEIYGECFIR